VTDELRTAGGVRLRRHTQRPGDLNWLFLPGGPGIGSESLVELVDAIEVPGTTWLVDLPGDGSNVVDVPDDPYSSWPDILLEAATVVPRPVFVGHSTGGMYLLSVPALDELLAGLVLISTAPNAQWRPAFAQMTLENPLPEVHAAENLLDMCVASAPWNFTSGFVEQGREFLGRMPYNPAAVQWSEINFDDVYSATWWPATIPTLILSGAEDRIVIQDLWAEPTYTGANVIRRIIDGAAHFPWIERPAEVRSAFRELVTSIQNTRDPGTLAP
jgi:pimeloyl-ACP methyl ester carboxylesterase